MGTTATRSTSRRRTAIRTRRLRDDTRKKSVRRLSSTPLARHMPIPPTPASARNPPSGDDRAEQGCLGCQGRVPAALKTAGRLHHGISSKTGIARELPIDFADRGLRDSSDHRSTRSTRERALSNKLGVALSDLRGTKWTDLNGAGHTGSYGLGGSARPRSRAERSWHTWSVLRRVARVTPERAPRCGLPSVTRESSIGSGDQDRY